MITPVLSYFEAILTVGVSLELSRSESGYKSVAHFFDCILGEETTTEGSGLRRSEAIGDALEHFGYYQAASRIAECTHWRQIAEMLDNEKFEAFALSFNREETGSFRVALCHGDIRLLARGDTPLEATRAAIGNDELKVPESFASNKPLTEKSEEA